MRQGTKCLSSQRGKDCIQANKELLSTTVGFCTQLGKENNTIIKPGALKFHSLKNKRVPSYNQPNLSCMLHSTHWKMGRLVVYKAGTKFVSGF